MMITFAYNLNQLYNYKIIFLRHTYTKKKLFYLKIYIYKIAA